ncbi:uncharacterized protein LOC131681866 isoform X2 [Topomyia yanbarensis]|uniref:uncharacterized protein LOC131681866 isoform X2 n=1 Tax=Topomyia yanbarensis TaxID=2498891 RepID=UPI00273AED32|nr:uncharacterized protein LOC131681866 isoform X2 [Topomyia yanbarensis]
MCLFDNPLFPQQPGFRFGLFKDSPDILSQSSPDRNAKIRKMIEVTRSTRYTEIVERNGTHPEQKEMSIGQTQLIATHDADFAFMDNSLNNLQEAMHDDKQRFLQACRELVDPYQKRLDQVEVGLEANAHMFEQCKQLEEEMRKEKDSIRKSLLGLLETSRKKRALREKAISTILDQL